MELIARGRHMVPVWCPLLCPMVKAMAFLVLANQLLQVTADHVQIRDLTWKKVRIALDITGRRYLKADAEGHSTMLRFAPVSYKQLWSVQQGLQDT